MGVLAVLNIEINNNNQSVDSSYIIIIIIIIIAKLRNTPTSN